MADEKNIHISQFYFCSKIKQAVELAYVTELAKCLYARGYTLSIDGVDIDESVKKSRFWGLFRIAVEQGKIVDVISTLSGVEINFAYPVDYDSIDLKNIIVVEDFVESNADDTRMRNEDKEYNCRNPLPSQVIFNKDNENSWLWEMTSENTMVCIKSLVSARADLCWLSMIAYVAVERLFTQKPEKFVIHIKDDVVQVPFILSPMLLLLDETNACDGWCFLYIDENVTDDQRNHLGYSAWYYKGQELGMLDRFFYPKDKLSYIKKLDIQVGDVVGVYQRYIKQQLDPMKRIVGFRAGIIRDITKKGISIDLLNTKKTLCQGDVDYSGFSMATKQMYSFENPFKKLNITKSNYDWQDIGVEYAMHYEQYFITPLLDDDSRMMYVYGKDGKPTEIELSANNLTYWILKDYNADFNEERFLERYFSGGRTPVYNEYN